MAVRYYKTGGKRYYVIDVSGMPISSEHVAPFSQRSTTTYAVLDRDWNHEEIAVFAPRSGLPLWKCKQRAYALADELNAREERGAA